MKRFLDSLTEGPSRAKAKRKIFPQLIWPSHRFPMVSEMLCFRLSQGFFLCQIFTLCTSKLYVFVWNINILYSLDLCKVVYHNLRRKNKTIKHKHGIVIRRILLNSGGQILQLTLSGKKFEEL